MSISGKHIFVIEDDPQNLAVVRTILEHEGAKVDYERWGISSTIRIADAMPVDLILLDVMFPHGINGYDIFNQIIAHPRLKNIPVVFVTATDPDEKTVKAKENGLKGFIQKPIERNRFIQQLNTLFDEGEYWDF